LLVVWARVAAKRIAKIEYFITSLICLSVGMAVVVGKRVFFKALIT
jgi:hypothetical protein